MNGQDVELTEAEREELAAGWPDFWQVHAAVTRIIAAREAAAAQDAAQQVEALADGIENLPTPYWLNATMDRAWKQGILDAADYVRAALTTPDGTP